MKTVIETTILLLFFLNCFANLAHVTLEGELGGRLDGKKWSSKELTGKVYALFYVDPDEKDLNNAASEALKKENFPKDKYGSIAIINMGASWLPNFVIASSLEEKKKLYPDTLYLKDYKKVLVEKWKLKDDSSNILVFDKSGELVYKFMGKLRPQDIGDMLDLIKSNL